MTPSPFGLLSGRVRPPDRLPFHVDRPTLVDQAAQGNWKVVTINAPGGFGKTTLLADLCRHARKQNSIAAWLTASADDTPERLDRYLRYSFEYAGLAYAASTVANDRSPSSLLAVIRGYDAPCFLVIDEVEHLVPGAVELLNQFLHRSPANLSIALGFRQNPGLDVSSAILDGRGIEFDADWLRFSKADIAAFFDGSLSRLELAKLTEQSEGWAVALSLYHQHRAAETAADAFAGKFSAAGGGIAGEWFGSRLLQGISNEALRILLDIAQFDVFEPKIVTEVLGDENRTFPSFDDLKGLVQPAGGESQSLRLNPLLRAYCRARLRRSDPARYRIIHGAIAKALSSRGQFISATRHAHEADDAALLGESLVRAGGLRLFMREGMTKFEGASEWLTDAVLDRYPRLAMLRCRLLIHQSEVTQARTLFEHTRIRTANFTHDPTGGDVEALVADSRYLRALLIGYGSLPFDERIVYELIDTHSLLKGEAHPDPVIVAGHATLIFAAYASVAMFEHARAYGEEAEATMLRLQAPHGIFHVNLNLGIAAVARGNTSEAERRYALAARIADEQFKGARELQQVVNVLQTELDLLRNRTDELPQRAFAIPVPFRNGSAWHEILAAAHEVVTEWRFETGGSNAALGVLETLRGSSDSLGLRRSWRHLSGLRVSHLVRDGRLDEAQREWSSAGLPETNGDLLDLKHQSWREMEALACARLRLLLALNRLDTARDLASELAQLTEERGLVCTLLRCLSLSMALEHQAGHPNVASAHLITLLRLLTETDYYGLLLREPAACRILPQVVAQAEFDSKTQESATALLRKRSENGLPPPPQFSDRERQILEHLAKGLRDKEIAREQSLSVHGVRYHLRKIYRKAGTTGRGDTLNWLAKQGGL